jgi:hypothetical protein
MPPLLHALCWQPLLKLLSARALGQGMGLGRCARDMEVAVHVARAKNVLLNCFPWLAPHGFLAGHLCVSLARDSLSELCRRRSPRNPSYLGFKAHG